MNPVNHLLAEWTSNIWSDAIWQRRKTSKSIISTLELLATEQSFQNAHRGEWVLVLIRFALASALASAWQFLVGTISPESGSWFFLTSLGYITGTTSRLSVHEINSGAKGTTVFLGNKSSYTKQLVETSIKVNGVFFQSGVYICVTKGDTSAFVIHLYYRTWVGTTIRDEISVIMETFRFLLTSMTNPWRDTLHHTNTSGD